MRYLFVLYYNHLTAIVCLFVCVHDELCFLFV